MHQRSLAANNDVTPILTVTHPLGPEVCVLCLLLASIGAVHRIVLLKLHGLHLLLDGVHGEGWKNRNVDVKSGYLYWFLRQCD